MNVALFGQWILLNFKLHFFQPLSNSKVGGCSGAFPNIKEK
jgi:hypothetical protein